MKTAELTELTGLAELEKQVSEAASWRVGVPTHRFAKDGTTRENGELVRQRAPLRMIPMAATRIVANPTRRTLSHIVLALEVLCSSGHGASAEECPVLHHGASNDTEKSLLGDEG